MVFRKAQEIIHHSFENPINILFLCKEIGVSERNLRHALQEHSGLSPKKYVRYYKLNKIRKLLRTDGNDKIIDVANQMGYCIPVNLQPIIKNYLGSYHRKQKKKESKTDFLIFEQLIIILITK